MDKCVFFLTKVYGSCAIAIYGGKKFKKLNPNKTLLYLIRAFTLL